MTDLKNPPTWTGVAPLRWHLTFAGALVLGIILLVVIL